MTQGRTRKEALDMIADWMETMVNRPGFRARVYPRGKNEFEISGTNAAAMTALLLRRRREATGASLRDVAARLRVLVRRRDQHRRGALALAGEQRLGVLL